MRHLGEVMQYLSLGKSSLRISAIGFGCMSLRGSEKEKIDLIHRAIDQGINFFDTADIYDDGANERVVGKALREKRNNIVLASKAGNVRRPDGGLDWNPSKQHILSSAEASLKRLGTDHIDLYQLHGGTINDNIDETIEAFEILKDQGKIRYYGISSIRPNVIREYVARSSIVSVMMQYSLVDRRPEESCLDLLLENRIGVLARGALAQGMLAGKPAAPYLYNSAGQVQRAAEAIAALSGSGRSDAPTALAYVLAHPAVTCAVAGIRTPAQLAELAAASGVPPLSAAELAQLRAKVPPGTYKDHR